VFAVVSPTAYWTAVSLGAVTCAVLCYTARRRPGPWRVVVARLVGLALAADIVAYTVGLVVARTWTAETSLPLALCNAGLAGTLQAVLTPDLAVGFPHLVFFEYVVGHVGIVLAALFLVVGMRLAPRPGAVLRVFAITAAYTAFVGLIDGVTGANYMFLRRPPGEWTLLRLLGPWPWYVVSAAGVALVLLTVLDLPFRRGRSAGRHAPVAPG
jgi:uncharacterized membrane protein YwaF